MAGIKAIETRYNGYRFRSRLEARWAVFFDTLGIRYKYEPEGYEIGNTRYLPDFLTTGLLPTDVFVEIKGEFPSIEDQDKAQDLATASSKPVVIFFGDVWLPGTDNYGIVFNPDGFNTIGLATESSHKERELYWGQWIECPVCHIVYLSLGGNVCGFGMGRPCTCMPVFVKVWPDDENLAFVSGMLALPPSERIISAFVAARSARFEFGETPNPKQGNV